MVPSPPASAGVAFGSVTFSPLMRTLPWVMRRRISVLDRGFLYGDSVYEVVRTVRGRLVSDASLRGAISSGASMQDTVEAILDVISVGSLLALFAPQLAVQSKALLKLLFAVGLVLIAVATTARADAVRLASDNVVSLIPQAS